MAPKRKTPADEWDVAAVYHPGHKGARHLEKKWGSKLVCVRYRYNAALGKRRTTVEIVVEEGPWKRRRAGETGVEIRSWEGELRKAVVAAGGRWDAERKIWLIPRAKVERLGLGDRVNDSRAKAAPQATRGTSRR